MEDGGLAFIRVHSRLQFVCLFRHSSSHWPNHSHPSAVGAAYCGALGLTWLPSLICTESTKLVLPSARNFWLETNVAPLT